MLIGKFSTRLHSHPGLHVAGPEAMGLYFVAYAWVSFHENDGVLRAESVRSLCGSLGASEWKPLADRLVAAGLWSEGEGAYVIAGFLDANPSAKALKTRRKKDAARKVDSARTPRGVRAESAPTPAGVPTRTHARASGNSKNSKSKNSKKFPPLPPPTQSAPAEAEAAEPEAKPLTKAERTDASHARYAACYAQGVERALGRPYAPSRFDGLELATVVLAHAKGFRGDALAIWIEDNAAAYVQSRQARAEYECGFSAKKFAEWLNAGRPDAKASLLRAVPDEPVASFWKQGVAS